MSLLIYNLVTGGLTQMIRNFAKSLENWLINSMSEMPSEIVNMKVRESYLQHCIKKFVITERE